MLEFPDLLKLCSLPLAAGWLDQIPFIIWVFLISDCHFLLCHSPKLLFSFLSSLKKPCKHPVKPRQAVNSLHHFTYPIGAACLQVPPTGEQIQPAWMQNSFLCGGLGTCDCTWWQLAANKTVFGWRSKVNPFFSSARGRQRILQLPDISLNPTHRSFPIQVVLPPYTISWSKIV